MERQSDAGKSKGEEEGHHRINPVFPARAFDENHKEETVGREAEGAEGAARKEEGEMSFLKLGGNDAQKEITEDEKDGEDHKAGEIRGGVAAKLAMVKNEEQDREGEITEKGDRLAEAGEEAVDAARIAIELVRKMAEKRKGILFGIGIAFRPEIKQKKDP
jgi:hypothetical protein